MSAKQFCSTGIQPVPVSPKGSEQPSPGKMPVPLAEHTGKMPVPLAPVLQEFDPEAEFDVRSRNLPHWRQEGATYFFTFRLGDSLPREKRDALRAERKEWLRRHPPPRSAALLQRFQALFSARIEQYLAAGCGACWLRRREMQDEVENAMRHFRGERYSLGEYVVMPNHVHGLVTPVTGWDLSDILHSWKSFTANKINRAVGRQGQLWQEETFDRIVRDEEELAAYERYIRGNLVEARLRDGEYRLGRG